MAIPFKNIFPVSIKWVLLLSFFLSASCVQAQDTGATPATITDTAAVQQGDTISDRPDYFDVKAGSHDPDSIQRRQVPPAVMDSLKNDEAFWYANRSFPDKDDTKPKKQKQIPVQWMDLTTFVVIVIIFLVLLGWYLFQNNVFRRTRSVAALKSEEISEQNIFAIDYHREIERAIQAANYRLAIRFMFLRLLADLSREGIIHYKQEKTNFDYLSQLNATVYYNDFFRLTRNYEFAWYGKFDISPETFTIIKNEFENFEHQWQ